MATDSRDLLGEIEAFLKTRPMAPSTFGRRAVNDGKLVGRLRGGGRVTIEKASQVRDFMAREVLPAKSA